MGRRALYIMIMLTFFRAAAECAGASSLQSLRIGVNTRASGMGGAYSALSDDASSIGINPAGLALLKKGEISLTHSNRQGDTSAEYLVFGMPFGQGMTAAAEVFFFNGGTLEGYAIDGAGAPVASSAFSASDLALGGAFAGSLDMAGDSKLLYGISLRYVRSAIGQYSSGTLSAGCGLLVKNFLERLSLGLSVMNFGGSLRYDAADEQLPLTVRPGILFRASPDLNLTAGADINGEDPPKYSAGAELWVADDRLCVRAGLATRLSSDDRDILQCLNFGAGFYSGPIGLEYAGGFDGELGLRHNISLGYTPGGRNSKGPVVMPAEAVKKKKKQTRPRDRVLLAVLDFVASGVREIEADEVTEIFRAGLSGSGTFELMSGAEVSEILSETGVSKARCFKDECAHEIGNALLVHRVVFGSVISRPGRRYIHVKAVDLEKDELLYEKKLELPGGREYYEVAEEMVKRLKEVVTVK